MQELIKLNDKLKFIKKVFRTPYHFFYVGARSNLVGIRFEDKYGKHFNFTGGTMFEAVKAAENYIKEEIKMGNMKNPEEK